MLKKMLKKLADFIENHPYLPIIVMVVLDVAGYAFEDIEGWDYRAAWTQLCRAFSSSREFMKLFPEEVFVFFTAYGLSHKMRTLKKQGAEVEGVVYRLRQTGQILEGIWAQSDSGKLRSGDDAAGDRNAADQANRTADKQ